MAVAKDLPKRGPTLRRVLADSLFDLSDGLGWSYFGQRRDGSLEPMIPNGPAPGVNGDLILMASDPYATIARDTLHPGQELAPALVFDARDAVRARLFVQSSLLLPAARLPVELSVKLGNELLAEAQVEYGSITTIQGDIDLPAGSRLVLCFSQYHDIRHLVTLYGATLLDDGTTQGAPPSLAVTATVHPAWAELRARLTANAPQLDSASLAAAVRAPFDPLPVPLISKDWKPAQVSDAAFGAFRQPNFFSARRVLPKAKS